MFDVIGGSWMKSTRPTKVLKAVLKSGNAHANAADAFAACLFMTFYLPRLVLSHLSQHSSVRPTPAGTTRPQKITAVAGTLSQSARVNGPPHPVLTVGRIVATDLSPHVRCSCDTNCLQSKPTCNKNTTVKWYH
eukprot:6469293-Amphidinium_carterae.3